MYIQFALETSWWYLHTPIALLTSLAICTSFDFRAPTSFGKQNDTSKVMQTVSAYREKKEAKPRIDFIPVAIILHFFCM